MSKAEEMAIKQCCTKCVHDKLGCGIKLSTHGRDCIECGNYIKGYHQAEKDLELTWEDLKTMVDISDSVYAECDVEMFGEKEYYQEILKRFKDLKHVK